MLCAGSVQAEEVTVKSPSGSLEVIVSDEGGKPTYRVALNGRQMLKPSALGLRTSLGNLTEGLAITNQTSIQCVALYPNNLTELQQFELDFLKQLPATWDETRFIDGYPGKYVVLARRHGNDWYIAGLNAQPEPLKLTLTLPMLTGKTATCYVDDKQGEPTMTTLKLDKQSRAKVTIQPNGGIIIK